MGRDLSKVFFDRADRVDFRFDDAEKLAQLFFKVNQGSLIGVVVLEVVEPAIEKIGEIREGRLGLGNLIDQLGYS